MRYPGMNYWAFSGNPRYYRVEDAVRELKVDFWTVPNRDAQAGDRVIIWKAKGNGQHRGIIALSEILTNPKPMKDPYLQHWVDQNAAEEPKSKGEFWKERDGRALYRVWRSAFRRKHVPNNL
jgi:hypothetical protein